MTIRDLPNLLTAVRLVLAPAVFAALTAAHLVGPARAAGWLATAVIAFVAAAVTDYFDGMLARRFDAASPWGAMLDPIADKIAVAAAVVGLAPLWPATAIPGALILFREVLVSGLRETGASRGLSFPVTPLAKWKTTVQLVALTLAIAALLAPALRASALALLWLAVALTGWTGWLYVAAARAQLKG